MKWVALASVILAAALIALLWEVRSSDATKPAVSPSTPALAAAAAPPVTPPAPLTVKPSPPPDDRPDDEGPAPEPGEDREAYKLDSDEFYARIDATYGRMLSGAAAPCYQGGKDRKQKLRLGLRYQIANGVVTVRDVRVDESTLGDATLEACMVKAVAGFRYEDPGMPDWSTRPDEEELVLIRIEGLKRFGAK